MAGTRQHKPSIPDEQEWSAFQQRVVGIVAQINYKPNFELLVNRDVSLLGEGRVYLQVQCWRPDTFTGEMDYGRGGKIYLSPHMVDSEIVRKAFQALLGYEEHEAREFFMYKGKRVFGPHIDVDALVEIADRLETRSS